MQTKFSKLPHFSCYLTLSQGESVSGHVSANIQILQPGKSSVLTHDSGNCAYKWYDKRQHVLKLSRTLYLPFTIPLSISLLK